MSVCAACAPGVGVAPDALEVTGVTASELPCGCTAVLNGSDDLFRPTWAPDTCVMPRHTCQRNTYTHGKVRTKPGPWRWFKGKGKPDELS